jgi:hypothetical protein
MKMSKELKAKVIEGRMASAKEKKETMRLPVMKAVHDKCLDCSGFQAKEVTLCNIVACPLGEYRTGQHISSPSYKRRMALAKENYPEETKFMEECVSDFAKRP